MYIKIKNSSHFRKYVGSWSASIQWIYYNPGHKHDSADFVCNATLFDRGSHSWSTGPDRPASHQICASGTWKPSWTSLGTVNNLYSSITIVRTVFCTMEKKRWICAQVAVPDLRRTQHRTSWSYLLYPSYLHFLQVHF